MVDQPITSWDAMFDPQYADQVLMINNSRDALGIALMDLATPSTPTARRSCGPPTICLLKPRRPVCIRHGSWTSLRQDGAGEAAVATYYAGDYLSMLENNEDLVYVVPEEGSNWFVDAMCILKNAENVDEAHEWINFMLPPMPA